MIDHPRTLSLVAASLMWLTSILGVWLRRRVRSGSNDDKDSYGFVVTATLTLLGLIISFTFSMAATRYDQRRLFEENEANAIGTEFVRVGLLPPSNAQIERHLLRQYLDRRIDFYELDYDGHFIAVEQARAKLQNSVMAATTVTSDRTAKPGNGAGRLGYERCSKQPGLHTICMVEPNSHIGLGTDVDYFPVREPAGWLLRETLKIDLDHAPDVTSHHRGLLFPRSRH